MSLFFDSLENLSTIFSIIDYGIGELSLGMLETFLEKETIGVLGLVISDFKPSISLKTFLEVQGVGHFFFWIHGENRGTSRVSSLIIS